MRAAPPSTKRLPPPLQRFPIGFSKKIRISLAAAFSRSTTTCCKPPSQAPVTPSRCPEAHRRRIIGSTWPKMTLLCALTNPSLRISRCKTTSWSQLSNRFPLSITTRAVESRIRNSDCPVPTRALFSCRSPSSSRKQNSLKSTWRANHKTPTCSPLRTNRLSKTDFGNSGRSPHPQLARQKQPQSTSLTWVTLKPSQSSPTRSQTTCSGRSQPACPQSTI